MSTVAEDMKQADMGWFFFKEPDPAFAFMSKNFKIYNDINGSWVDFLRKSVEEMTGENAGQSSQWRKAMEDWQQLPAQVFHNGVSPTTTMKEYMQYCVGRQETYTDLGIAWINCLQKMSQAFREARQNGDEQSDAWKCCFKASEEFVGAGMSFAEERIKALYQLWSVIVQKNATFEKRASNKVKEEKTSKT